MANPYAIDQSQDVAPMERGEYERLLRSRLVGRCALALGLGCYFGDLGTVEVAMVRVTGSELSALLIFIGIFFLTRALRCRTRDFDRMKGFVRYEELEARAEELDRQG